MSIIVVSTIAIGVNIYSSVGNVSDTIRHSFFQVSSIITTTGYSTVDFNLWPVFSKTMLVALMFIGGCAGSTAGGLKVSRVLILVKSVFRDLRRMMRPRSVASVRMENKSVDRQTLEGVTGYLTIYVIIVFISTLLLSLNKFDFETTFTSIAACFNNIGPGLGGVGPMASFAEYSAASKVLLSFLMLLGRLEIYPLLLAFSPALWKRK